MQKKRLGHKWETVFADTVAQKAAEALAIATRNFVRGNERSHEVFGIGIRHFYFTFWHATFSHEYLRSVSSGQQQWRVLHLSPLYFFCPSSNRINRVVSILSLRVFHTLNLDWIFVILCKGRTSSVISIAFSTI